MSSISQSIYLSLPTTVQNWAVSLYGYRLARKRYGGIYKDLYAKIEKTSDSTKAQIENQTLQNLRNIVGYAIREIPYYRELYTQHGLTEDSIRELKDLEKFPPLEKETLKRHPEAFVPENIEARKYFVQRTSGTTGTPLEVHVDENTYKLAMALLAHHEIKHGVKPTERRATFAGRMIQKADDNRGPFCRYNSAENQMIFSSYHIREANFSTYWKQLSLFKPAEIIGYPSAISEIARLAIKFGAPLDFKPKLVVSNSETLLQHQRDVIEEAFQCPVFDYYGTAEYVVFAGQCKDGNYHINPLLGYLEIVDDENISIVEGEGDMLCTSLSNHAMPLIRYRIGDRARKLRTPCSCGSHLESIASIEGRIDDALVTADGKKIGRLDHIYKGVNGISEAQIVQHELNKCTINIVKDDSNSNVDENLLTQNLRERMGDRFIVDFCYKSNIERGKNGKFIAVINSLSESSKNSVGN